MNTYQRIIELIAAHSLTINRLEKEVDLPICSIAKWKDDKIKPSSTAIIKLANYFGVTTDYLLCVSNCPKTPETQSQCKNNFFDTKINDCSCKTELAPDEQSLEKKELLSIYEKLAREQQQKLIQYSKGLLNTPPYCNKTKP